MDRFLVFSKGLLVIASAGFVAILGYLALTHPDLNYREQRRLLGEENDAAEAELRELQEWHRQDWSDVDVGSDKYPIVVLRDSFKVLRIDADSALVGWRYEIINTSPEQAYSVDVRYTLQDADRFDVAAGSGSAMVQAGRYQEVFGTISVSREDVRRLDGSSWTIRLDPDWEAKEAETKGTRYERLTEILKTESRVPMWIQQRLADEDAFLLRVMSDKWKAVAAAYDQEEHPAQDQSGQ